MSKYASLQDHLTRHGSENLPMTFAEIERIIGDNLPPSARRHRAWWSNNPSNSVITHAWLAAGYRTSDVDMERGRLVFRRDHGRPGPGQPPAKVGKPSDPAPTAGGGAVQPLTVMKAPIELHHPVLGCLAGTITILAEVDLTDPADEDWGR